MKSKLNSATKVPRFYLTSEAGAACRFAPSTLRKEHSLNGHFKGIRPVKMPGGRLLWPADQVDRLARGESITEGENHGA